MTAGTLGKYEVRREIGRGSMGLVYEGFDPFIERVVALKVLRLDDVPGEDVADLKMRFRREAQAAGRLAHPNIVSIFDYGETAENHCAFIAMELVDGKDLKSLLTGGRRFSFDETVRIAQELLSALQHAHERGVVHRDIKPANVLLLRDGTVKVADFGIAKFETSELTQAGMVLGTVSHMSPEQLFGSAIDRRTDIFSSAIVLYQLLTGTPAFSGSAATVIQKVLNVMPPPPSSLLASVPKALDAVILKAMAKDPDDRYATAGQFWEALSRAVVQAQSEADEADRTVIQRVRRPSVPAVPPAAAATAPPIPPSVPPATSTRIAPPASPPSAGIQPPTQATRERFGWRGRSKALALTAGGLVCAAAAWVVWTRPSSDDAASRQTAATAVERPSASADVPSTTASSATAKPVRVKPAPDANKPAPPSALPPAPVTPPTPAPATVARDAGAKGAGKPVPEVVKPVRTAAAAPLASSAAPSATMADTYVSSATTSPSSSVACFEEARRGDARCQVTLAGMYKSGRGVAANPQEALRWYKLAGDQGVASAQFEMASMLFNGQGADRDVPQALVWAERAGAQGLVAAQNLAGLMYAEQAKGDPTKYDKAVEWHQRAAAQGSGASLSSLANLTWYGRGTPKDTDKALDYWRAACDRNHTNSCFILGQIFAGGSRANPDEASRYYKKSLAMGGLNDSDRSEAQAYLKRATQAEAVKP